MVMRERWKSKWYKSDIFLGDKNLPEEKDELEGWATAETDELRGSVENFRVPAKSF